ncbi:MAG: HAD family phosphatase [Deltaproteobacteria bacterium]|nr:MAG: HAD family phosphatase [Deltaproteobacteria bacterium]RTZ99937.1 MAG: HAD family phosphatase [Deltaproteobacteria bacterium]
MRPDISTCADTPFDLILFDLGGVLIELSGIQQMLDWSRDSLSENDLWRRWLSSPAVRDFESGRSSPDRFAREMIVEFNLSVSATRFLYAFTRWTKGLYAGADVMLKSLSERYALGILSNTNALHWHRFETEMNFLGYFDFVYPSHLTGYLKPDRETFQYVAKACGYQPGRILFLDDNTLNTDSAKSTGFNACRVSGVPDVLRQLTAMNLIG